MSPARHLPPFDIHGPSPASLPVFLSSPHSGDAFPQHFLDDVEVSPSALRPLGDGPLDKLYACVCEEGVQLLGARFSRAVVDLNRAPDELAPEQLAAPRKLRVRVTEKVRLGLGVVPSRVNGQIIRRTPITDDDLRQRLFGIHLPYHQAIEGALAALAGRFGHALLLDCHSMPSGIVRHAGRPVDIVIGDAYGASADPALVELACSTFAAAGYLVRRNQPYAGGYVTRRHGEPARARSALQIEVRRDLFMDENTRELREDGCRVASTMRELVRRAGRLIIDSRRSVAAA
ncbi:MAG: N-formylglutamate amidohydrolase [Geminicoccaceae bacterium]